jgi:hypothetical protein
MFKPPGIPLVTLAFLTLSCSRMPHQAQAAHLPSDEEVLAADRDLSNASFTNGPIPALAGALGTDGTLAWPGGPVLVGSTAAATFLESQPLMATARISWQPLRVEMSADSTLAVITGVATIDRAATNASPQMHRIGRYLAAWKRVGSTWQLAA